MKLISYNHGIDVELSKGINNIVIENKKQFRDFILECKNQIEGNKGNIIISNCNKDTNLKKGVNIITDIFNLDLNKTEFIKIVISDIIDILQDERYYSLFLDLKENLETFLDDVLNDYTLELEYDHNDDIGKILKLKNINIYGNREELLEKLIIYLNTVNKLLGINIFITVNISSFYSREELKIIDSECKYNDIILINIDNINVHNNCYTILAIDDDLCRYI